MFGIAWRHQLCVVCKGKTSTIHLIDCPFSRTADINIMQHWRRMRQVAGSCADERSLIMLRANYKIRCRNHKSFRQLHGPLERGELWNDGYKKSWAVESEILGTQQRFRTVVSTNLKNICSFFRVNLYRVYISRRVRFSNFLFVCVACVSFIVFVMCVFYPCFLFPGVVCPLEIKRAHFPVNSYLNDNDSTSGSMWYSSLLQNWGHPEQWKKQETKILLETGRGFSLYAERQDFQDTSARWLPIQCILFPFIV